METNQANAAKTHSPSASEAPVADPSALAVRRLVLIDDDPVLGNAMVMAAKRLGFELDYFESMLDLGFVGRLDDYDVAIVDYDLGSMNGIEIAEYLDALFGDIPMLLVSCTEREARTGEQWPAAVRRFVRKDSGYFPILEAAAGLRIVG